MEELYWITRIGTISNIFSIASAITCVLLGISITVWLINGYTALEYKNAKEYEWLANKGKTFSKIFSFILLILAPICIFTPTSKEMVLIYGVGGTIDYIKNDSVASNIPNKVIVALDKYLEDTK